MDLSALLGAGENGESIANLIGTCGFRERAQTPEMLADRSTFPVIWNKWPRVFDHEFKQLEVSELSGGRI